MDMVLKLNVCSDITCKSLFFYANCFVMRSKSVARTRTDNTVNLIRDDYWGYSLYTLERKILENYNTLSPSWQTHFLAGVDLNQIKSLI